MTQLTGGEMDVLHILFTKGPLRDGSIPSKVSRDTLVDRRLVERGGDEGWNWLTSDGVRALINSEWANQWKPDR